MLALRYGVKIARNGRQINTSKYPYRLKVTLPFVEGERLAVSAPRIVLLAYGKSVEGLAEFAAAYVPKVFPWYRRYTIEDLRGEVITETTR